MGYKFPRTIVNPPQFSDDFEENRLCPNWKLLLLENLQILQLGGAGPQYEWNAAWNRADSYEKDLLLGMKYTCIWDQYGYLQALYTPLIPYMGYPTFEGFLKKWGNQKWMVRGNPIKTNDLGVPPF